MDDRTLRNAPILTLTTSEDDIDVMDRTCHLQRLAVSMLPSAPNW